MQFAIWISTILCKVPYLHVIRVELNDTFAAFYNLQAVLLHDLKKHF